MAKRSYPTSKVRGSGQEYQTATAQERPRGTTQRPRSAGAAERRYPASEVRDGDERSYPASEVRGGYQKSYPMSKVRGHSQEEIPYTPSPRRGAMGGRSYPMPLSPRPRTAAGRSNPTSKEPWLRGRRKA